MIEVLDLFSAAAGGWSLGMHRAGFTTMAACEAVDWRRVLYSQNNPSVKVYDDVRTLTAERLLADLGRLPSVVVGSPPCQDISSANTKGKGVEGERSGLFFEAVRLIGECRPRWFALENSANLRTRGADAVLAALEALGYACWTVVVRAANIGANHERPRSWIIGCDLDQVADADGNGRDARWSGWRLGSDLPVPHDHQHAESFGHEGWRARGHGPDGFGAPHAGDPSQDRCGQGLSRGRAKPTARACVETCGDDANPFEVGSERQLGRHQQWQGEVAERADIPAGSKVELRSADRCGSSTGKPLWSLDDLAARIRLDDGLPARVAGTRVAVGGPRGTVAASLIVEAYGDAVVPQIPEAIGRAILRVERAMQTVLEAA